MKTLIAGRFVRYDQGETAASELKQAGFSADEISLFHINPQGQHDLHPLGGDEDESVGTHDAGSRAVASAAGGGGIGGLIGLAALPVLGPTAGCGGRCLYWFAGGRAGRHETIRRGCSRYRFTQRNANNLPASNPALQHDAEISPTTDVDEVAARQPGVMLAVATAQQRADAETMLGRYAYQIQQSEGDLRNSDWIDFNPLATPEQTG